MSVTDEMIEFQFRLFVAKAVTAILDGLTTPIEEIGGPAVQILDRPAAEGLLFASIAQIIRSVVGNTK